jgi:hypothetical protein
VFENKTISPPPNPKVKGLFFNNRMTEESNVFFQPKLTIGAPDDAFEMEADAVADKAMQMSDGDQIKTKISPVDLQRKCSHCEEEEKVRRKDNGNNSGGSEAPDIVNHAIRSSGQSLDNGTQSFMESRFGYNFSNVKIHTDALATKSAQSINALAYTSGNNIIFNEGQYSPGTERGKKLLAHELTHVVQQSPLIQSSYIQRESIYEDVAHVDPGHAGGVYTGAVDRYEYNDQSAYNARIANSRTNTIGQSRVRVSFDSNRCVLEVPVNMQFVNHAAGINTTCGDISGVNTDPVRPVSSTVFTDAVTRIMRVLPEGLNNWFKIRIGNPSAMPACASTEIPITVNVAQVAANPDYTIVITANNGRSHVTGDQTRMVMCGTDVSDEDTIIHEGGHFILGHGDEYHESSAVRPSSRERLGEYSRMAQDAPGRLQEFYRRHFNFAVEFMNSAFPNCQATLVRGSQGGAIEYTPNLSLGVLTTPETPAFYASLGLQFGIPLTQMRRLSLALGPNFTYLGGITPSNRYNLSALMMGFRAGLSYRSGSVSVLGSSLGLSAGIHGEAGGLINFAANAGALPAGRLTPYAEGGGHVGISLDSQLSMGLEGAGGVITPGEGNPDITFYRVGFRFAVSF